MNKTKLLFIVDDTLIMLPYWLSSVIEQLSKYYSIVGITPLRQYKKQFTIYSYLKKNIIKLNIISIFKLFIYFYKQFNNQLFFKFGISNQPGTIKQVAIKYDIPIINTRNVNDASYLKRLRKLSPDIIISSGSQIFKKPLLEIPKIACINRHSGALPSYGGLFPIFQCMKNREKKCGVTIHYMVEKIDKGQVIYQEMFPIRKSDTLLSLYEKSYQISNKAILRALKIIKNKTKPVVVSNLKPSYYSFPSDQDWKLFFSGGNKFV